MRKTSTHEAFSSGVPQRCPDSQDEHSVSSVQDLPAMLISGVWVAVGPFCISVHGLSGHLERCSPGLEHKDYVNVN